VQHFLGGIGQLSGKFQENIIAKNTWGDGLYFVFSDVDLAGKFALDLADFVAETKWEEKGFRSGLNLRIGLHAGPVYEFDDPIPGSRTYSGTHVSRAARIEPITPRGSGLCERIIRGPRRRASRGRLYLRLRRPNPNGERLWHIADVSRAPRGRVRACHC